VLEPLAATEVQQVLELALVDEERGLGQSGVSADPDALETIAQQSFGDVRSALNLLEIAAGLARVEPEPRITIAVLEQARQAATPLRYDKAGEQHYDVVSAFIKSMRGSDPDAAVYWLMRMLEAGEDPLYVARRLVRFASEDIGLADPQALVVAMAAQQAVHFIGLPEGALALAELVVYLAAAPKSNAVYLAYAAAAKDALESRAEPVPLWIRNAPTNLMKDLGYGQAYRYAHDEAEGVAAMDCLPEGLVGRRYYHPTDRGEEKSTAARLEAARLVRERKKS